MDQYVLPLYIPNSATDLAACHRLSGVTINGTSATPPREGPKEVVKPVRSDEDAQIVPPIRFCFNSRSHSHTSLPIADSGTPMLAESGSSQRRGK
jgi:hypothetical protein